MMTRRQTLQMLGAAAAATSAGLEKTMAAHRERTPFLLSNDGCSRATGYAETNKIVTLDGKTHVAWLDSVEDGFRVRVRTLDRGSGRWSPTCTVGEAYDNHGGPALAVDSRGHLHCVYYPHHHPFRYRRSSRPNDASAWDDEVRFGNRCTYPTLVVGPDDTLYVTCRESNSENKPWVANLYTKTPEGEWQGPTAIMVAEEPGYSHFQEALAWGADHTLHLSTRMYGGKPGRAHTVGYMRSPDLGKTWEDARGNRLDLPATSQTLSLLASDLGRGDRVLRCGSIAVDPEGTPHVLYSDASAKPPQAWVATPTPAGEWRRHALFAEVRKALPGWSVAMPGGLAFGDDGRLHLALTAEPWNPERPKAQGWGDDVQEVMWLESADGSAYFDVKLCSTVDARCAHWLPNIERATGHNRVAEPGLIYTAGTRGDKNTDIVSNGVWWGG